MLTKVYSASIQGIDAFPVTIETDGGAGSLFMIVGLPDTAVKESHQRIVSAISHSGVKFPHKGTTINLAPADIKKEGAAFDLPMAIGVLSAHGLVPPDHLADYMIMGELSLDGSVLPVKGALPMAVKARELGFKRLIVPEENVTEAAVVNKIEVFGVKTLGEALALISDTSDLQPVKINTRELFAAGAASFVLK